MDGRAKIRNMHTYGYGRNSGQEPGQSGYLSGACKDHHAAGISALLVASEEDKIVGADEVGVFSKDSAYPDHTPVM